jgi:LCP family protein required for cell wall assembly
MAGGTGKGSDDFDWMYGERPPAKAEDPTRQTQRPRKADVPEPTMMLPTQPRAGQGKAAAAASGAKGTPPPSRGLPPARPVETQYGATPEPPRARRSFLGGGWDSPRRWLRIVGALLVLWLVYTIAVPFFTWAKVDKLAFEPGGHRPDDQPGTTYLLVGNDSRSGLTKEQRKEFHTGDPSSKLTDTIMLLHTGSGPNTLLSIPRDSYVASKWGSPNGMINGLYSEGGYKLLVKYLESTTGIRIDKFVEIGLGGVAGVVDAVGGIEVCPKTRMVDKDAGLRISKGCQNVDGRTALAYSRSRHAQVHGDLDRVRHQREVVAAIGDKVMSPWSVINPFRWWKLNSSVPGFFSFGDGMSKLDVAKWAMAMRHTTPPDGLTCTMPVTDGSAHYWDRSRARPIFKAFIEDSTSDITDRQCTPTGLAGVK